MLRSTGLCSRALPQVRYSWKLICLISVCPGQMCGGYGRDLVSLAQQITSPLNSSASCTGADSAALSLGREGVGEIVALGSGLCAQGGSGGGGGGEWALGQRVWFSPRIAANQGALSGHVLLTPGEVAPAPEDLPDPEAAAYPFAVSTAWTALVDCAGVQPAPLPPAAAKFAQRRRGDNGALGLDSPLDMLKAAGQQGLEMLGSLPLPGAAGELASRLRPVSLSPTAPRRALVHGASGAVGLVAVQLLQRWGWEVWATTTPATRSSLDKLQQAQEQARAADAQAWASLPPFHIVDTSVQPLSSAVGAHSLSLFLDGVGGDAAQALDAALPLLAPTAQFVTLRGEGVAKIDREGFVQGAISGSVRPLCPHHARCGGVGGGGDGGGGLR